MSILIFVESDPTKELTARPCIGSYVGRYSVVLISRLGAKLSRLDHCPIKSGLNGRLCGTVTVFTSFAAALKCPLYSRHIAGIG
jgi:hypothetical protein